VRLILKTRQKGEHEFGIIYGTIAIIALTAAHFLPVEKLTPACPFRSLSGLSCPSCGASRALVLAAHGGIEQAFLMNPLLIVVLGAALIYFIIDLVALVLDLPRAGVLLTPAERKMIRPAAWAVLLGNWIYLIFHLH
jgi:hypothetical protein